MPSAAVPDQPPGVPATARGRGLMPAIPLKRVDGPRASSLSHWRGLPSANGGVRQVSLLSVADRGHGFPSNEPPGLLEGIRLKRTSLGHAAW